MAFGILGSHLSDHTRSLAEDPSVSGRWPHARSAPAKARVARGLIADGEVGGVEAAMGLELGVEAALEDAADQKRSLDGVGGVARLDRGSRGPKQNPLHRQRARPRSPDRRRFQPVGLELAPVCGGYRLGERGLRSPGESVGDRQGCHEPERQKHDHRQQPELKPLPGDVPHPMNRHDQDFLWYSPTHRVDPEARCVPGREVSIHSDADTLFPSGEFPQSDRR